jgi:hypothetical protein
VPFWFLKILVEVPLWGGYYQYMINTLTYEQAVEKYPAIAATGPSSKASSKYNFISTGEIVHKALENDWVIRDTKAGRGLHGVHTVNLVHKSQVEAHHTEGFPQISLINSHNLSRRFSLSLGFFRLVCSNGLIAPTGLCQSIRPTLHRPGAFGEGNDIIGLLNESFGQFDNIVTQTQVMKERQLSEEERKMLAHYAYYIRFRYRMMQPKKVNLDELLKPRRSADEGTNLWTTFNVIQENLTRGGKLIGNGITQFQDELRFNQELWTGIDKAVHHKEEDLEKTLKNLFRKKERPNKTPESLDN